MELRLAERVPGDAPILGVPVLGGGDIRPLGTVVEFDQRYLADRHFDARMGETVIVPADDGSTIVAVGLGAAERLTPETLRVAAACFVRAAWNSPAAATTLLDGVPRGMDMNVAAQAVAEGARLGAYRFTRYKGDPKPCRLETLTVVGRGEAVRRSLDRGARVAAAVAMARDLVNEPASAMTPRVLAQVATKIAASEGLDLTVWDENDIVRERLGGLLGVAAGSVEPPRFIRLVYDPPGATASIALVGKGITFDSGGLSIKTAEGMETMKTDMSGAAAVLATMWVLPALGPKVKVIGLVPTTENMPGGAATKPGDVLTIRNGKTVEVLNTDAEGRLVLADGLSLAVEEGVDVIVDLATLTGACIVALGRRIAGLMGNDVAWIDEVHHAAERTGEPMWPLPLFEEYRRLIDSEVADVKNISGGRYGGALTAGLFLKEFAGDIPWAHLDIAGPARSEDDEGYLRKGGTGFGVRTLVELISNFTKPA
ncbi:MAG: leucyl aminopeptidase [Actinomycetota bacterium]|nr:leucyl aminopeptidase [Actinomycetota bacterium]